MEFRSTELPNRRRRVHRKVKTGCQACKIRRQKCGEQKPKCAGCIRYSTNCSYIPPDKTGRRPTPGDQLPPPSRSVNESTELSKTDPAAPSDPSKGLNFDDLELLHQFITSACISTGQLPEATQQLQTAVPQLAQEHPFLMRGMLAKAAILLSWERPAQRDHYILQAAKHHAAAFPEFRSALQRINEQNHLTLILYSKWLVWCAFSRCETFSSHREVEAYTTDIHWLPSWFYLLHGSCLLLESCKAWIKSEWHLLPPPLEDLTDYWHSSDSQQIVLLTSRLLPLVESSVCEVMLTALHDAFAQASMRHHNNPLRNAGDRWFGAMPSSYVDELHKGVPWALVILAHFNILVCRSETRWFMEGHAVELLDSINQRLDDPWKEYLKWPFEEIGSSRVARDQGGFRCAV